MTHREQQVFLSALAERIYELKLSLNQIQKNDAVIMPIIVGLLTGIATLLGLQLI